MSNGSNEERPIWRRLRFAVLGLGLLFVLLSLFADELGLDSSPRFGLGEWLLLGLGLSVLGCALLGRRALSVYRYLSVVFVTAMLLLAALELGLRALFTLGFEPRRNDLVTDRDAAHYLSLSYYQEEDWAEQYWHEALVSAQRAYRPYVVWRRSAFDGETITIDQRGHRVTPGAECRPGAYTIMVLGGSTTWGWGAPDWGTIPAFLQQALSRSRPGPVCVLKPR